MMLDKDKFSILMYALTKNAAQIDFLDFLDRWGLTEREYDDIRDYLKATYGVLTYV